MKIFAASQSFCKFGLKGKPGQMLEDAGIKVVANPRGEKYREGDLLEIIGDYDGLITGTDEVSKKVIKKGKKLKIIAKNGVGYDNIDVPAATERGVYVTTTPGAVEQAVADSTIGLMLDLARNITVGNQAIRSGSWERIMGTEIWEKRLGIIGMGTIGKNVARRAQGFNMEIFAFDPFIDLEYCAQYGIKSTDLNEIFNSCDFISIHCLLNEATRNLVSRERLNMMKPTAYIINTSRGGVIDETALVEALKEGRITGAGLDVFEKEPLPEDSPLLELDNVILTPHIAGYSRDANLKAGIMVAESVIAALNGIVPPNLLNTKAVELRS